MEQGGFDSRPPVMKNKKDDVVAAGLDALLNRVEELEDQIRVAHAEGAEAMLASFEHGDPRARIAELESLDEYTDKALRARKIEIDRLIAENERLWANLNLEVENSAKWEHKAVDESARADALTKELELAAAAVFRLSAENKELVAAGEAVIHDPQAGNWIPTHFAEKLDRWRLARRATTNLENADETKPCMCCDLGSPEAHCTCTD